MNKDQIVYVITYRNKLLHIFAKREDAERYMNAVLFDENNMRILQYVKDDICIEEHVVL